MSRAAVKRSWLAAFLHDGFLWACAAFTLAFVLMPPDGLGIDVCACKRLTGAPCPGCGMTRCGSNFVRGDFRRGLRYHPFGLAVIPACAALGLLGLTPRRWREGLRAALLRKGEVLWPLPWLAVGAFVIFGLLRWCLVFWGWTDFPAAWP